MLWCGVCVMNRTEEIMFVNGSGELVECQFAISLREKDRLGMFIKVHMTGRSDNARLPFGEND